MKSISKSLIAYAALIVTVSGVRFAQAMEILQPLPTLTAANLARTRENMSVRFSEVTYKTSTIDLTGTIDSVLASSLKIEAYVNLDTTATQNFADGSPLFGKIETDGHTIKLELTGKPKTISALRRNWVKPADFAPLMQNVSLRFLANYSVAVEPMAYSGLEELAGLCGQRLNWQMKCQRYAGLTYSTPPKCFDARSNVESFFKYVRIIDPFILNQDTRVHITAVTQDLCDQRLATTPIINAIAGEYLHSDDYKNWRNLLILSQISMNVKVYWK